MISLLRGCSTLILENRQIVLMLNIALPSGVRFSSDRGKRAFGWWISLGLNVGFNIAIEAEGSAGDVYEKDKLPT